MTKTYKYPKLVTLNTKYNYELMFLLNSHLKIDVSDSHNVCNDIKLSQIMNKRSIT